MENVRTVIMTVGLPGSGKSTWARRYAAEHGFVIHSSDGVRERIYGDESVVGDFDEVFGILYEDVDRSLSEGRDVIIDNTGLTLRAREVVKTYHDRGFRTVAVVFDTPLGTCLRRNASRDRKVPEDVIRGMARRMREPSIDEGFDEIIHVKT